MSCDLLFLDLQCWHFLHFSFLHFWKKNGYFSQGNIPEPAMAFDFGSVYFAWTVTNYLPLKQMYWSWLFVISHQKNARLDPTFVCTHLEEVQPDESHRLSLRGEKNPLYEALVWGLAMDQFGSSKKQMTEWTYMYRRLIVENVKNGGQR